MGIPPQEFRFLLAGHNAISEKRSLTAIRSFKNMSECDKLHLYTVSDKKPIDPFLESEILLKDSRSYELCHNSKFFTFYAYEFFNNEKALSYFMNATDWEPQNKTTASAFIMTILTVVGVLFTFSFFRFIANGDYKENPKKDMISK